MSTCRRHGKNDGEGVMKSLFTLAIMVSVAAALFPASAVAFPAYVCKEKARGDYPYVCSPFNRWRCKKKVDTDGCSVPPGKLGKKTRKKYKSVFRRECVQHDVCFVFHGSRQTCNRDFRRAMRARCNKNYPRPGRDLAKRNKCKSVANVFYAHVATRRDDTAWDYDQDWRRKNCRLLR